MLERHLSWFEALATSVHAYQTGVGIKTNVTADASEETFLHERLDDWLPCQLYNPADSGLAFPFEARAAAMARYIGHSLVVVAIDGEKPMTLEDFEGFGRKLPIGITRYSVGGDAEMLPPVHLMRFMGGWYSMCLKEPDGYKIWAAAKCIRYRAASEGMSVTYKVPCLQQQR